MVSTYCLNILEQTVIITVHHKWLLLYYYTRQVVDLIAYDDMLSWIAI